MAWASTRSMTKAVILGNSYCNLSPSCNQISSLSADNLHLMVSVVLVRGVTL